MLAQWQGHSAAVPLFEAALQLNEKTRGSQATHTGQLLLQLANAQALAGDVVTSKATALRAKEVLTARLGPMDEKTIEAENLYDVLTKAVLNRERGEQAKLGRLARRLGLDEGRTKELLDRGSTPANKIVRPRQKPSVSPQDSSFANLPVDELVTIIEKTGTGPKKGKKRSAPTA